MRIVKSFEEMKSLVGQELGVSKWIEVSQDMIDKFADATGDHPTLHGWFYDCEWRTKWTEALDVFTGFDGKKIPCDDSNPFTE